MGSIYLRKYGVATTIDFCLYELDGTDLKVDAASASGDIKIMKDEGAEANLTADAFVDEGTGYSLAISNTEMQAARIVIYIVDQTSPKTWLDKVLIIETYGNASAQHAFDLNTATVNLSVASEAQIDAIETDTNEIQGKLPTNKIMGSSVVTDKDDEIDAIKAKTDNLPSDPADESNLTALITTVDTVVDAIKLKTDNLPSDPADQSLLEAEINASEAKIDTIDTIVDAIKAKTDNLPSDPADDSDIDSQLSSIQTSVTAIQNNTRFTAATPTYMTKPDAGNEAYRLACNVYDTTGNMEDPDDNEVVIRVMEDDGTYMTTNLYKDNALTTALDNATDQTTFPAANGWRALVREASGKFYCFYKVTNTAIDETLTAEFGWEENSVAIYQSRSTEVADVHGDLTAILTDTTAIKAKTDLIGASVALETGGNLATVKAKTDNLPSDPADESLLEAEINANETKIDALQTDVTAIKGYVDTEIAAIKAVTDTLSLATIADAVHDETVEGTYTLRELLKIISAALAGKLSGGGTNTLVFRDVNDSKDRITATVDANKNRTNTTLDAS